MVETLEPRQLLSASSAEVGSTVVSQFSAPTAYPWQTKVMDTGVVTHQTLASPMQTDGTVQPQSPTGSDNSDIASIHANVATLQNPSAGLVIIPIFDSSINNDPNSAAIKATINQAIANFESQFSDPITVTIKFQN